MGAAGPPGTMTAAVVAVAAAAALGAGGSLPPSGDVSAFGLKGMEARTAVEIAPFPAAPLTLARPLTFVGRRTALLTQSAAVVTGDVNATGIREPGRAPRACPAVRQADLGSARHRVPDTVGTP